ncbi:hypothetical protein FOQG_14487 [Fusarium oxysporum f. sp. raphani 54005]|uniref:Fungal N-terminal domain-containing protein n=1 Tax=Fusarium oxysporum f. sp. raphani 54005 TaxID=1089458 RepID=X0BRE7_FUSOX|nr:hypothetical protein FOQG_14487 [Fusarium oxysporum f. sp. raphani 54005]
MGDPLSIASGVAGLISLGLTVCDSLHTYFSAIKDRKDDIAIITQSLSLFKFHIFAVQSSASKLGNRHSPAIDGLQLSLINCEMQLKCLETLLNKLIPTEDPSLAKDIWRRQKLTARYPFDRKKLVQLEEYLSRANVTLSSFIQALNLDINIHMSDELEACKTSLEALDINTQTTLRTITTRLEVIGPRVEPSALELLPSRIEDVTASSSNSIVLHQAAVSVAETKTSFHGNERSFEDLTKTHSKPRYLQNAELERRLCKELPLDFALFYSKIYCNAPDQWTDCDDCTCYVSVQLFLEADCNVTIGYKRSETLGGCSLKARKLFFEHLKNRRQRLRNMALAILPEESLHRYGVTTNVLPDKTAPLLWSELQEAKEQRDQLPVDLTDSLKPYSGKLLVPPESLFDFPHHLQVASTGCSPSTRIRFSA